MNTIHHPSGITVEIVGIEANSNGQSCHQHDVCGSLVEEDVVLRLRKVQILNSLGREETANVVVLDSYNVTLSPTPRHLMVLWHKLHRFMVLGAKVQSSERNGDTTVVVVLRHLSLSVHISSVLLCYYLLRTVYCIIYSSILHYRLTRADYCTSLRQCLLALLSQLLLSL